MLDQAGLARASASTLVTRREALSRASSRFTSWKFCPEDVRETALRQAPVQGHLAALEPGAGSAAGTGLLALVPAPPVLPWPEPGRGRAACVLRFAPLRGARLFSLIIATAPLPLDEVAHLLHHAADLRRVLVDDRRLVAPQPERLDDPPVLLAGDHELRIWVILSLLIAGTSSATFAFLRAQAHRRLARPGASPSRRSRARSGRAWRRTPRPCAAGFSPSMVAFTTLCGFGSRAAWSGCS